VLGWECYGYMGPFDLGDVTFDDNVVDLSLVISPLPLVIKVDVGASSGCENCVMGGKIVWLLRRLADLWWRLLVSGLFC
jgi:hypothetical protein